MSQGIEVRSKKDGVVLRVDGLDIEVTVRPTKRSRLEEVQSALSEFKDYLNITEDEEGVVVKPTTFLGKELFAQIATKVKALGGEYISAGKESRFLIR